MEKEGENRSQVQFRATLLRSSQRAAEKLQCRAWRLGRLCPFSASPQDTDKEAEVGLGPIHGREGRQPPGKTWWKWASFRCPATEEVRRQSSEGEGS